MSEGTGPQSKIPVDAIRMAAFVAAYPIAALLCLVQWNSATDRWKQLDVFSGGYLVLSLVLAVWQLRFLTKSPMEVRRELFGFTYDPGWTPRSLVLGVGELTVFIDYGHLHMVRALRQPALQLAGLLIYAVSIVWFIWVDGYLGEHFRSESHSNELMRQGPYSFVRHPRYAGLLATRLAMPLILSSVIGWALAVGWVLLVGRRIKLEEKHLLEVFGDDYKAYAKTTARLVPGIF